VSDEEALTAQAKKRLDAIQMLEDLGAGFYLAMHDLEIRGAGEVLGESQSGEMQEVGFSLYTEMLTHAVNSLKAGKEPDLAQPLGVTSEINLHSPALLPDDYCGDVHERLVLYKRLANCASVDELQPMQEELIDRFGLLPEPAQTLVEVHRLRILSKPLGIARLDISGEGMLLQFVPNPPIDAARIISLIQKNRHYKLSGQDKLKIEKKLPLVADRVDAARAVFRELTS
jgi:transcription-repair coupling factor (superfamily II helicase)